MAVAVLNRDVPGLSWSDASSVPSCMATSTLVRPSNGRMLAGVCAGLANRFGISTGLVRLAFVLFGLFGAGEIVYIVLWIIMPKD